MLAISDFTSNDDLLEGKERLDRGVIIVLGAGSKACVKQNAEILDIDRALGRVGGDLGFLLELVGIFQAASSALMDNVREAVACGDVDAVERTAHLFKAAAEYVSATKSYDAALQLERMAQAGRLHNVQEALEKLEQELALLSPRLAAFENALWFAES